MKAILVFLLLAGAAQAKDPKSACECRYLKGVGDVLQKINKNVYMLDFILPGEYGNHREHLGFVKFKKTKPPRAGVRVAFCMLRKEEKITLNIDGFDRTVPLTIEDPPACAK